MIRRFLGGRVRPRSLALAFFVSIVATGAATGFVIALLLLRFLSGSFLAAMGDACGGIFAAGHGLLAESNWNYLLATAVAAITLLQLAFLLGGGARLLRRSHGEKSDRRNELLSCPALPRLVKGKWASRTSVLQGVDRLEARTVGLLRPRILISKGMAHELDSGCLAAVIAHEEAHRAARDNLLLATAKSVTLTLFYLPGPRMALRELRQSLERAADAKAARTAGGSLTVAEALARVALSRGSMNTGPSPTGNPGRVFSSAISGNGSGLGDRLSELIDNDGGGGTLQRGGRRFASFCCGLILAMTVFASSALAVAGSDQRQAFLCFTQHEQSAGPDGICLLDHPDHH